MKICPKCKAPAPDRESGDDGSGFCFNCWGERHITPKFKTPCLGCGCMVRQWIHVFNGRVFAVCGFCVNTRSATQGFMKLVDEARRHAEILRDRAAMTSDPFAPLGPKEKLPWE